jgi:phosphotransferase system, enzyme I, PtsP
MKEVLKFVEWSARGMPLVSMLDEAPRLIARLLGADVCSVYLREGDGHTLVMRGNVGFGQQAVGRVQLEVGQGITGSCVAARAPTRVSTASEHEQYIHFDDLGEDQFPVFLAAPILGRRIALGAVVVQRRDRAFSDQDVERLLLLSALIAAGIRTAEILDERRERPVRKAGGGTRKLTLTGRPVHGGRALGAAAVLRRPGQRPSTRVGSEATVATETRALTAAFETAEKSILALQERAQRRMPSSEVNFIATYMQILGDMRFRERALECVAQGHGIASSLGQVAREANKYALSFTRDSFLEERARDMEDLCDALVMLASGDQRADLPTKGVLLGDAVTVFDVLMCLRAHPVGVALTERAISPRTNTLLALMDVPAITGVEGLFRWASDGDIVMLDADHGLLVINPAKSEIAAMREWKRRTQSKEAPSHRALT